MKLNHTSLRLVCPAVLTGLFIASPVVSASDEYFNAKKLSLKALSSDVTIRTSDQVDRIRLGTTDPSYRKGLSVQHAGDTLVVKQTAPAGTSASVTVVTRGAGSSSTVNIQSTDSAKVHISGNGVQIIATTPVTTPVIELMLPESVEISFHDFSGEASMEDVRSTFYFHGSGTLMADSLNDTELSTEGNASVHVKKIGGNLIAELADNAELQIDAGRIRTLRLHGSGNSDTVIDATVDNAEISANDNTNVEVERVRQLPEIRTSDNADVIINNAPQGN